MPAVSFIIPVKNDAAQLRRCLRSIAHNPMARDLQMIVADNGSTDGSADVARMEGAEVLDLPGLRLGELRNRAAAAARGEVLAFVDADHEIGRDWVHSAIDVLSDRAVAAVGAPYHPPVPATWVQRFYDRLRRHPATQEPVEWLGSGNLAVRRSAFTEVRGFDTSLETCEDVDLCRKLRAGGYTIVADHRMRNVHHGDPLTLRQVFFGELWRGRDNVRVSLRRPRSGRTVVSAVVPVANLTATCAAVAGLVSLSRPGFIAAGLALAVPTVIIGLRALFMARGIGELPKAIAVAAAYEAGRSLALAGRFGHARRRAAVPA